MLTVLQCFVACKKAFAFFISRHGRGGDVMCSFILYVGPCSLIVVSNKEYLKHDIKWFSGEFFRQLGGCLRG